MSTSQLPTSTRYSRSVCETDNIDILDRLGAHHGVALDQLHCFGNKLT